MPWPISGGKEFINNIGQHQVRSPPETTHDPLLLFELLRWYPLPVALLISCAEGPLDVLGQVMMVVAIPSFTVMAFRGWDKDLREALPAWRNAFGKVAIVVIPLPLSAVFVLFLLGTTGLLRHLDATSLLVAAFWFAVAGMILALALKGLPRLEVVLAGVLTLAFLYSLACF